MRTSENQKIPDVFRGYIKKPVLTSFTSSINVTLTFADTERLPVEEGSIIKILASLTLFSMINSLLTTSLLAIGRYIAVKYSLRYKSLMTKIK